MKDETPDSYLWDRTGEPDREVARLEELLGPLGHHGSMPPLTTRRPRPRGRLRLAGRVLSAAAALIVGFGLWFVLGGLQGAWPVEGLEGAPLVDGVALGADGVLRRGGQLVTDAVSRARIDVGRIGRVVVDPQSRVALVASGLREHRLSLERGTIHARIWAPPRFFFVNTPFAETIDLGCAFTLQVDEQGAGLVRVTHGWVQFAHDGREAYIPQGAVGTTRPGVGPGTPRYEDAPAGFAAALDTLDYGPGDAAARGGALDYLLAHARAQDALTLWHLLSRGTPHERARVFAHLSAVAPPPAGATREAILAGDRRALDRWWDSFRFEGTSFWGRLKNRF
jgi:hypothetical protein